MSTLMLTQALCRDLWPFPAVTPFPGAQVTKGHQAASSVAGGGCRHLSWVSGSQSVPSWAVGQHTASVGWASPRPRPRAQRGGQSLLSAQLVPRGQRGQALRGYPPQAHPPVTGSNWGTGPLPALGGTLDPLGQAQTLSLAEVR